MENINIYTIRTSLSAGRKFVFTVMKCLQIRGHVAVAIQTVTDNDG